MEKTVFQITCSFNESLAEGKIIAYMLKSKRTIAHKINLKARIYNDCKDRRGF